MLPQGTSPCVAPQSPETPRHSEPAKPVLKHSPESLSPKAAEPYLTGPTRLSSVYHVGLKRKRRRVRVQESLQRFQIPRDPSLASHNRGSLLVQGAVLKDVVV